MPFGIGYLELATILICTAAASAMYITRMPQRSWSLVVLGCVILASGLTPADLFSMLILAVAFLVVYILGTRQPLKRTPTIA